MLYLPQPVPLPAVLLPQACGPAPASGRRPAFSGQFLLPPASCAAPLRSHPAWDSGPALPAAARPQPGNPPVRCASSDQRRRFWPAWSQPSPCRSGSSGHGGHHSHHSGSSAPPATVPSCPPESDPAAKRHSPHAPPPAPPPGSNPDWSAAPWLSCHPWRIFSPVRLHRRRQATGPALLSTAPEDHFRPRKRDFCRP